MPGAILVPVDGSSFAEHALTYGLGIARRTGAVLHLALVHVPAEVMRAHPMAERMAARLAEERVREGLYLEELARRLDGSGADVRPVLLHGNVVESLSHYVEQQDVHLVVMTTHGRGGLQRAWLGSTTDGLVRRCPASVLLIRPSGPSPGILPTGDGAFRRILAALDGGETAEQALDVALDVAATTDASVTLTHVTTPPVPAAAPYLPDPVHLTRGEVDAREARMARYVVEVGRCPALAHRDVEIRMVRDFEPARAILDLADAIDADLLVLGTHGRGGLRRVILGSVADRVIRGTARAVLVHRGELARPGRPLRPEVTAGRKPHTRAVP